METFEINKPLKRRKSVEFQELAYVFWGVVLLIISSQLSIPVQPVPITLQSFGIMIIGLIYKRTHAIIVVLIYLGLGAIGAPGFANYHGGVRFLFGPSGGYLWGFLGAVIAMTTLRPYLNYQSIFHIFMNCLVGTLVIHLFGVGWLIHLVGFHKAVEVGFFPFMLPSIIKIVLLTASFSYYWKASQPRAKHFDSNN